jgi:predicted dinucleotide-binding enzyme
MRIAVLGTGSVGRALTGTLHESGHQVTLGTRDPDATLARRDPDAFGNPPARVWLENHSGVGLATFAEAAAGAEFIVNATNGRGAIAALVSAGEDNLAGKTLLDVSNPLDPSLGIPPSLSVCNTDSLGEQIQRRFPGTSVVKALNTVTASLMVDPRQLAGGDHSVFVSGNDPEAKAVVTALLADLGHHDIIDLGDITTARGTEMYLPLWLRLMARLGTPVFNIKIIR